MRITFSFSVNVEKDEPPGEPYRETWADSHIESAPYQRLGFQADIETRPEEW